MQEVRFAEQRFEPARELAEAKSVDLLHRVLQQRNRLGQIAALQIGIAQLAQCGRVVAVIDVGKDAGLQAIDVDTISGDLWVALQKALRRYAAGGMLRWETPIEKIEHVASDGEGGVWLATAKDLRRLDPSGRVLFTLAPFVNQETIVALVVAPSDSSAWVASQKALSHISAEGQVLQDLASHGAQTDLPFDGRISALALYADIIAPLLSFTAPVNGTYSNTSTPDITLTYRAISAPAWPRRPCACKPPGRR